MEIQQEIWKDVKGYEGLYQVSNLGRFKSLERVLIRNRKGNSKLPIKEKILKPYYCKKGYLRIGFRKDKKLITFSTHRIIAQHFIDNPENKPQINHINGIKDDNRIENLEWCTPSENLKHSYDILNRKPMRGSMSGVSKLTDLEVLEIKNLFNKKILLKDIALKYKVSLKAIECIKYKLTWKHL